MKLKKIIIDITVIVAAFILFVIWYENCIRNTVPTSELSNVKYYEVYLITPAEDYQFWEYVNKGAADMSADIGINYKWLTPSQRDPENQNELINQAVDEGADALLVAVEDPKLISGVIEDAKAKGVKVVYVDAPATEEAIITLATNNYEAGLTAGKLMITTLERMGIEDGSIGIISKKSKATTMLREEGIRDAFAADSRYSLLETEYTNGDPDTAKLAAENIINKNMDLVGLFGTNEGNSQGMGEAIKDHNNRYVGIGFDKSDITMKLLSEGSLKAIINQNPYTMGYLGMAEAVAALLGRNTGPNFINTGYSVIEK